ncbi:MAG: AAA family ATPase [Gammaproteobacteria bacterium]|nr:AAA family ATPase [Gammaproteobacteria bacterium]
MATVVLITGAPASGKTTLARTLADGLELPILAKDRLKETLFDALPNEAVGTDALGIGSFRLLLQLVDDFARGPGAFIVENAFRAGDGPALQQRLGGANVLHIHCDASHATLEARFGQRVASGERHPSHRHADLETALETYAPPQVCSDVLTVPTDDFGSAAYREAVAEAVARATVLTRRG